MALVAPPSSHGRRRAAWAHRFVVETKSDAPGSQTIF